VRELRLVPGPEVGRILETLEEESFAGALTSRQEAIERARQLIGDHLVGDGER